MNPWAPWDADEEELAELRVVRERIPPAMRRALTEWVYIRLNTDGGYTSSDVVNVIQGELRVDLDFPRGFVRTEKLVSAFEERGDQLMLRLVDWILGRFAPVGYSGNEQPDEVTELQRHLDTAMSGVRVALVAADGNYRLRSRLPEGVEEAAQVAVDGGPKVAGQHLAKALRQVQNLEPDTSAAMTESIRAVEAAAGPVVIPKDKRPQLSKIVAALKDKPNWTLVLQRRDDGVPDHHVVLIGMLETLAFAQQDRHSGEAPTTQEAMAHTMLAATLVGWFSTNVVQMNQR